MRVLFNLYNIVDQKIKKKTVATSSAARLHFVMMKQFFKSENQLSSINVC